jgi:hypothetical protein
MNRSINIGIMHSLKKQWKFVATSFLLIFSLEGGISAQPSDPSLDYAMECATENSVFLDAEELVYKIYYNLDFIWIPAGEVKFSVKENEETYTLIAVGTTYSSYEWFYKVDDYYETVIDKSTLLPQYATRTIREGGYRLYEEVTFDQNSGTAHVIRGKTKEEAVDQGIFDMEHCSSDILGLFFRLRNVDRQSFIEAGGMPISFFLDMELYDISMRYVGQEKKRIRGLGQHRTIHIRPNLIAGHVFKEGDELSAWVSDDGNRVPLLIESPLTVGSAKAVLKSYRGLKYDLGSS